MTVDIGYHRFICDICQKEEFAKGHPEGWVWLKPLPGSSVLKVEHACAICKESIPKVRIGRWGERT